jgi:hypothetical protein
MKPVQPRMVIASPESKLRLRKTASWRLIEVGGSGP